MTYYDMTYLLRDCYGMASSAISNGVYRSIDTHFG